MQTIKEVAKMAGVGLGTVSRVLNDSGYVKESTRQKVLAAVEALHYVPNDVARNLRHQSTRFVGLIIPTIWHPFFSKLAYFIEQELYLSDYKMLLCNSEQALDKELRYFEMLQKSQVAGIIMISYNDFPEPQSDLPIVTIDRIISPRFLHVSADNSHGGELAAQALVQRGCRKLLFLGSASPVPTEVNNRREAFVRQARELGVACTVYEETVLLNQEMTVVQNFLAQDIPFDGALTSSDLFAAALIKAMGDRGQACPEDFQVIGFDGIQDNPYFKPILATIRQPVEKMARKSVEMLLDKINNQAAGEDTIIDIEFFAGETIKPIL